MQAVTNRPRLLGQCPSVQGGRCRLRTTSRAAFNFAPATDRGEAVHGCCMPGFADPLPSAAAVGPADIASWAEFMRSKGVSEVIVLLGEDELDMFSPALLDMYSSQGFQPHHIQARSPGAVHKITKVFKAAEAEGKKVVCHCTGGCHRVGAVLAGWIATRYGLSYEEAAQEMAQTAKAAGVNREAPNKTRFEEYASGKGW